MKGHMQDGKFHPHTQYKKGTRKSRDQKTKVQGLRIKLPKKIVRGRLKDESFGQTLNDIKNLYEEEKEDGNIPKNMSFKHFKRNYIQMMREQAKDELKDMTDQEILENFGGNAVRKARVQPDLGHGTGKFAEFKSKKDFWDYLQDDRHVARRFEDNSPNMEPRAQVIMSRVVNKTPTKVGFESIHQPDIPISYLYKSELKDATFEPDTMDGGTKVVIHDKDDFTDLRRVYRVWNGY